MVETSRLESGHTLTGIGGSNPSLSAILLQVKQLSATVSINGGHSPPKDTYHAETRAQDTARQAGKHPWRVKLGNSWNCFPATQCHKPRNTAIKHSAEDSACHCGLASSIKRARLPGPALCRNPLRRSRY